MLPEGWTRKRLAACAKFVSGGTPNKDTEAFWGGDFPWITAKDMKQFRLAASGLTLTEVGKAQARAVPAGSILVLTRGMTLLKDLPVCVTATEAAFNQDVKALLPVDDVDADYLACQLIANKHEILGLVDTAGHGTGRLDTDLLKDFEVAIAPKAEQERVAKLLAVWDASIATTERLLANSRQQRQALLGLLLHAPVLSTPVEDRERNGSVPPSVQAGIPQLPATPKGWRHAALGQHLREVARPVVLAPEQDYDLVTVKRSRGGVCLRERLRGDAIKTPTQFRVEAGDFLISKRQIVHGACGIVPPALAGAIVSNEYAVLNSDGGIDLHFLRYLSESIYFQQTCYHSSIGVHVEKMIFKTERWLGFPFNLPPLDRQHEIVRELDAASAIVESTAAHIELLRREKSALMQQLLTGKRRVRLPAATEATC